MRVVSKSSSDSLCLIYMVYGKFYWGVHGNVIPTVGISKMALPQSFKDFPNTRIVLDGTEIDIEPWSHLLPKNICYSNYKGRHTVKFLVGIAPNGVTTFVSKGYPGSTSDKDTVVHSGVLEQMMPGDMIMADKGFLLHDILPAGVTLNIPAGLWGGKKQYSQQEINDSRAISRARVHVERTIGYIKIFKILASKVDHKLLPYISKIFYVCAMLNNCNQVGMKELYPAFDNLELTNYWGMKELYDTFGNLKLP